MGISKKKFRKQVKAPEDEYRAVAEAKRADQAAELEKVQLMDDLFAENTGKGDIAKKREKLKADRFKELARGNPSKTEQILIKRMAQRKENREAAGVELPKKKSQKTKNEKEDEEFGGLQDLWAAPAEAKSKKFDAWKNGFAERDFVNVKAVIQPKSGQSYNPQFDKHQELLQEVAQREEEIIEKNMKDLKTIRPFLFEGQEKEDDSASDQEQDQQEETSQESEAEEGVQNKPVDRKDIKTKAQRNKDLLNKLKQQAIQEEKARRKFHKDIENVDKLMATDKNQTAHLNKRLKKRQREEAEEIQRQVQTGVVRKPKNVGRFKYTQRKQDFQLEDDLSGNLRQLKPIGNASLLGDRFDSIFRRNLVEPDAPTQNEKRRQRKLKFKMVNARGTKAERLYRENMELKAKSEEMARGAKQFRDNSDVIMI